MGIKIFSSSVYDGTNVVLPNPDPANYEILGSEQYGNYLLVQIKYPNCTTFEGIKILVYKDITIHKLRRQKIIDPHFSNNKQFYSPIARFVPTEEGIELARKFCQTFRD